MGNEAPVGKKKKLLSRMARKLTKSREAMTAQLNSVMDRFSPTSDELWNEIEEILISADVGIETTAHIVYNLKEKVRKEKAKDKGRVLAILKQEVLSILPNQPSSIWKADVSPNIILMVGVNGTGKTTSIAKIAYRAKQQSKEVLLAAADTFRAAAIDQLAAWAKRINVDMVKHERGGDAAAVVYDAISKAKSKGIDIVIVDTAGRLHTKVNLMEELKKIKRVAQERIEKDQIKTLLCVDATSGQNVMVQTETFNQAVGVDSIVLTKLDGTAKGGIVIGVYDKYKIPISYIGIGEKIDDLIEFNSQYFVEALLTR